MSRKYKFYNPEGVSFAVQGWGDVFTRNDYKDILRDFKKFTSKAIIKAINDNPQESRKEWLQEQFSTSNGFRFWRSDNKPIELWTIAVIDQKFNYIHQNPVEEGLAVRPEHYLYSSACEYAGEKGCWMLN